MTANTNQPVPPDPASKARKTVEHLVSLYSHDRSTFAKVSGALEGSHAELAAAAEALARDFLDRSSLLEAEAALQVQTLAHAKAGDSLAMLDAGIRMAEVMKVRAESLEEYDFARNLAKGLAGTARTLRRPHAEFTALTHAADAAYFASQAQRATGEVTSSRAWLLTALIDCVEVLDVLEVAVNSVIGQHFLSLVLTTVDQVMNQFWFDSEEVAEQSTVSDSLRRIATAVENHVPRELNEQVDPSMAIAYGSRLARLLYRHGSPDIGYDAFNSALERCKRNNDGRALLILSAERYCEERRVYRPSHRMQELRQDLREKIEPFRSTRRSRAGRVQAAETLDRVIGLMAQDEFAARMWFDIDAAFDAVESNKARVLLDEVQGVPRTLQDTRQARQILDRETRLLHLDAQPDRSPAADEFRLLSRLPFGELFDINMSNEQLEQLEQQYAILEAGFMGSATPTTLRTIIATLQPGEAILSYLIPYEGGNPAGSVLILLVTSDGALPLQVPFVYDGDLGDVIGRYQVDGRQPLDVSPLGQLIATARYSIREGDDAGAVRELQQLYRALISPLADHGVQPAQFTRLIIVPSGVLNAVPFSALQNEDGTFLLEQVPLVVVPSASIWKRLVDRAQGTVGSFFGLADPSPLAGWEPLPDSRREVEEISDMLPELHPQIKVGESATESVFRLEAPGKNILHLATHGDFPEEDALDLHRIVLSPDVDSDGLLHAEEVRGLDLSAAELVTLSICDGALIRFGPGDEPWGLVSAFFVAGASNIIAPLWEIDDVATAEFMQRFYRELLVRGPAEALQTAGITLMRQKAEIRDWAGFALLGAGRPFTAAHDGFAKPVTEWEARE